MDKKFFTTVKKEAGAALHKVIGKVEEVSKISGLKLKQTSLKSHIKSTKTEIGELVFTNRDKFAEYPEIQELLKKIDDYGIEIEDLDKQIEELKEHEEEETPQP